MAATAVMPPTDPATYASGPVYVGAKDGAAMSPQGALVASPTNTSSPQPTPSDAASPSSAAAAPGWIPAFSHNQQVEGEVVKPASNGSGANGGQVAVGVADEVPQAVSEEQQEREKEEAAKKEVQSAGWFKQNLAKVRGNLCGPLHIGDLCWSAGILLLIILTGTGKNGIQWFWLFLFLLFYLWYLHWNWKSDERVALWNMMDIPTFEAYWKKMREQNPVISMRTESWHWERRVSHHTTYNANGGSTTTTTVTYVRVVSHTETVVFQFSRCDDLSLDVEGSDLAKNDATFVHLWKEYSFGDLQTALNYHMQLQALKQRNISRDTNMDTFEYMEIPGWTRIISVYRERMAKLIPLNVWFFLAMCVILMSWPMKIYIEFVTKKGGFTMKKRVTC